MSRVTEAADVVVSPGMENDPYRLGWRYVKRRTKEGKVVYDQVPLTPEDVLYPQEEDFIVQDTGHVDDCIYLKSVLQARIGNDAHTLIVCDCRISWDVPGVKPMGPDIGVIFGVKDTTKRWGTFDCMVEGARPSVLFEVTSDSTRVNDIGIKVELYYQARVPWYVIVDRPRPLTRPNDVEIIGYRAGPDGYERLPLDEKGRLWIEPINLWLGVEEGRVVLYDGETPLRDLTQELAARQAAEARVDEGSQARQAAEARVDEESQARQMAEDRVRELEDALRKLGGGGEGKEQ